MPIHEYEIKVKIKISDPEDNGDDPADQMPQDAAADIIIEALAKAMQNGTNSEYITEELAVLDTHGNWQGVFPDPQ